MLLRCHRLEFAGCSGPFGEVPIFGCNKTAAGDLRQPAVIVDETVELVAVEDKQAEPFVLEDYSSRTSTPTIWPTTSAGPSWLPRTHINRSSSRSELRRMSSGWRSDAWRGG